jgi:RNA 2',3'-cyclic 3'-phosphodiesterase
MRLFVGVEIDAAVKDAAAAAMDSLRDELTRAAPGLEARWIARENLHITLWFIGEVSEPRADAIREALGPPIPVPRFHLSVDACGAFPPAGVPRVLWFGVRSGAAEMGRIYQDLQPRLVRLGFVPERRPYSPHLTIARVKDAPRTSVPAIRQVLSSARVDLGQSPVDMVTLFRSRLSPRGATYEPVLRVPLS